MMMVVKRSGKREPVDFNKIVARVASCAEGLVDVDSVLISQKTIPGIHDGVTTEELDLLAVRIAAEHISIDPDYAILAARLMSAFIREEVASFKADTFAEVMKLGHWLGLVSEDIVDFVEEHGEALEKILDHSRDGVFRYFGIRTVYDRYLLKHPETRKVIERPQHWLMRVAVGIHRDSENPLEQIEKLYHLMSDLKYLPSTPTLFNAGTLREQMSSCFLLDSPKDSLDSIYENYADVAQLSKFAGGIGLSYSRVRAQGSLIKGTNGISNGIVPFLKTLDSSVKAVNQGGKRKGAACVYLDAWHADVKEFLELRENTGEESRRTHNLNLANWIPDLFMERMNADGDWSLFSPDQVPELVDSFGDEWRAHYLAAEAEGKAVATIRARELYERMMRALAETGNGWMCWRDSSNLKCNQTGKSGAVVHSSNLCTEIIEVTSDAQIAVCNLGSICLSRMVKGATFDFDELRRTTRIAVRQLDKVIPRNFYAVPEAHASNSYWRPVGLGQMGFQDVCFKMGIEFDSEEARLLSARIAEVIYFEALGESVELAKENGAYPGYGASRMSDGKLQFDLWADEELGEGWSLNEDWDLLREKIDQHGVANSLLIAIAPTATIASISGCYECVEPQVSNLFKRETLSGDFLQINRYLVEELKALGLWDQEMRDQLKLANGSVQSIARIPQSLKRLYRTAWEYSMKPIIELAAARGPFIDQSQSLNLFVENPSIGKLSSMYNYAWKKGLKTTYYLRSRAATSIAKTTVRGGNKSAEELACSLENPEACEACQ